MTEDPAVSAGPDWRRKEEGADAKPDQGKRSEARRDHDRVFYSSEFERLEDVTQIATLTSSVVRNRLTHSYRVEQIARSIAAAYPDQVDEDVVMTAALVHDIGHAPFGHTGEEALQKAVMCDYHRLEHVTQIGERQQGLRTLESSTRSGMGCAGGECLLPDGFEGNAQSFRILTLLASNHIHSKAQGLNLTRRVLYASLKYPWLRGANRDKLNKWGVYDGDADAFAWVINSTPDKPEALAGKQTRSIEASIMDTADDIAYAIHDLEDAYKAGLVPFSELSLDPVSSTMRDIMGYLRQETNATNQEDRSSDESSLKQAPLAHTSVKSILAEFDEFDMRKSDSDQNDVFVDDKDEDGLALYPKLDYLQQVLTEFSAARYSGSYKSRQALSLWRGNLIRRFVNDVQLVDGEAKLVTGPVNATMEFLQQLTWYFVIDHPDLSAIRAGQERLIIQSFESLFADAKEAWLTDSQSEKAEWKTDPDHRMVKRLPERLADYVDLGRARTRLGDHDLYSERQVVARAVVDYICSLTDSEVYSYSMQLAGSQSHSVPRAFS